VDDRRRDWLRGRDAKVGTAKLKEGGSKRHALLKLGERVRRESKDQGLNMRWEGRRWEFIEGC
jgi:hypothetical protein